MKIKLNAATRLAASNETSFPHLYAFFKVHDENIGGHGSHRSDTEHRADLAAFIREHGLDATQELEDFLKPLNREQLEDVSDVSIGEQPRTVKIPKDILHLVYNLFPEEDE